MRGRKRHSFKTSTSPASVSASRIERLLGWARALGSVLSTVGTSVVVDNFGQRTARPRLAAEKVRRGGSVRGAGCADHDPIQVFEPEQGEPHRELDRSAGAGTRCE